MRFSGVMDLSMVRQRQSKPRATMAPSRATSMRPDLLTPRLFETICIWFAVRRSRWQHGITAKSTWCGAGIGFGLGVGVGVGVGRVGVGRSRGRASQPGGVGGRVRFRLGLGLGLGLGLRLGLGLGQG